MKKPSCHDELTIRHRFDRLCQMSLKGEAINYYRHMDYRREHEAMFSELSEKELNQLSVMDEYGVENSHFTVHGYDIEVKDVKEAPKGCICGPILRGLARPEDCKLFRKSCNPLHPIGACMVSKEGTCNIAHRYSRD